MLKEKGRQEVNWNWQAWDQKYGISNDSSDEEIWENDALPSDKKLS